MNFPDILSKQKWTPNWPKKLWLKKRTLDVSATPCIVGLLWREYAKRYIRLLSAISIDWYFATHDYSGRRKRLMTVIIRENVPTTLIRNHVCEIRVKTRFCYFCRSSRNLVRLSELLTTKMCRSNKNKNNYKIIKKKF